MLNLISPIDRALAGRSTHCDAIECKLAFAAPLALCLSALLCASGCVSSGATAASNNAQGVEYFTEGQYDKAIARFQSSLQENPDSAETYYNLGSAYQRKANETGDLNLLSQAEDAYWTALELNPAPETIVCCYRGIATSSTARGDAAGAMRTLEEWRDRNPDSIEPKLEIAYLLEAQERDDDAYDALQEIAQIAPNDYRAFYKMGTLSERAGDLEDAIDRTNVAAQLNPENVDVAQRARNLESRFAAQQRAAQRNAAKDKLPETNVAIAPLPAAQTARVQSTSAQAESETPPELVLPEEEQALPVETIDAQPQGEPSVSANSALGFGEIVAYSSQGAEFADEQTDSTSSLRATRSNSVRFAGQGSVAASNASSKTKDDSDVKWISAAAPQAADKIAQTSAAVPQNNATASPAKNLATAVQNLSNAAETTASNLSSNATQPTQPTQRPETASAPRTVGATNNRAPQKNRRRDLGSGMPGVHAGSIF